MSFKVMKLDPNAKLPVRGSSEAAGVDFYSLEGGCIPAGGQLCIPTGVAMSIPPEYGAFVWPRSKLANKKSLDTMAGLIDSDYRGQVMIILFNHSNEDFHFDAGDKISQVVIQPVMLWEPEEVDSLEETERGDAGINSADLRL